MLNPYKITIELTVSCPYANLSEEDRNKKCDFLGKDYRLADKGLIPDSKLPTIKSWCHSCMHKGLEYDINKFTSQFKSTKDPIVKVKKTITTFIKDADI
jgi:hypothetical protein